MLGVSVCVYALQIVINELGVLSQLPLRRSYSGVEVWWGGRERKPHGSR